MADLPTYKINIDKKVLRLLGSQLYGDTPSIIAELVQNSYDADANNVWITINTNGSETIIVEDDGIGMTPEEINDRFLNIGLNRRDQYPKSASGRNVLGRKGIGKLAVFSLAKIVDVYSRKGKSLAGCRMDYDDITLRDKEPEAIHVSDQTFDPNKLSLKLTGTKIVLNKMQKSIARSFTYIVNRLTRTFDVNDSDFKLHIRKNDDDFRLLTRKEIDYYKVLDTVITIGDEYSPIIDLVRQNSIEAKYKFVSKYEDLIIDKGRIAYSPMPYQIKVIDKEGNVVPIMFTIQGWIGTVFERECFQTYIYQENKEIDGDKTKFEVSVNDNRISVFSRGKIGEFNILPKTQTNKINDAYIVGEIFADIFEDDKLADMAISNRRGYDETDQRYVHLIEIVSKLVRLLISKKEIINSQKKKDIEIQQKAIEEAKIKAEFTEKSKRTRLVLEQRLNKKELDDFEEDLFQFGRALNVGNATKKIFISHKADCEEYGKFIVRVFELIGGDTLISNIIFTAMPELGVPHGIDIYDYLKECFRDDLYVIFLFSKSFYNSNVCIAETGAAWATNKNYSNLVVDIEFSDVDEPINRNSRGARLREFDVPNNIVDLQNMFSTILRKIGLSTIADNYTLIEDSIRKALTEYSSRLSGLLYIPQRRFLAVPTCPICNNLMRMVNSGGRLVYQCTSRSCTNEILAEIS